MYLHVEYCEQNKLTRPNYTKYAHDDGFRYEVDVEGTSCFGVNKFYKTATEAIHASAHAALYSLLITGPEVMSLFRGVGFAGGLLTNSINKETATARVQKPSIQSQGRTILYSICVILAPFVSVTDLKNRLLKLCGNDMREETECCLVTQVCPLEYHMCPLRPGHFCCHLGQQSRRVEILERAESRPEGRMPIYSQFLRRISGCQP